MWPAPPPRDPDVWDLPTVADTSSRAAGPAVRPVRGPGAAKKSDTNPPGGARGGGAGGAGARNAKTSTASRKGTAKEGKAGKGGGKAGENTNTS